MIVYCVVRFEDGKGLGGLLRSDVQQSGTVFAVHNRIEFTIYTLWLIDIRITSAGHCSSFVTTSRHQDGEPTC